MTLTILYIILSLFVIAAFLMRSLWWSNGLLIGVALIALFLAYQSHSDMRLKNSANKQLKETIQALQEEEALAVQPASAPLQAPSLETEAALDELKIQYEELLVNYYYLKRCSTGVDHLYHQIMTALLMDLAAWDAPASLVKNISLAAEGLYQEMYAASECTPQNIEILTASIQQYLDQKAPPASIN